MKINYLQEGYFKDLTVRQEKKTANQVMTSVSGIIVKNIANKIEYIIRKYNLKFFESTNLFDKESSQMHISGKFVLNNIKTDISKTDDGQFKIAIDLFYGDLITSQGNPIQRVNLKLSKVFDTDLYNEKDVDKIFGFNRDESTIKTAVKKEKANLALSEQTIYEFILKSEISVNKIHLFSNSSFSEDRPVVLTTIVETINLHSESVDIRNDFNVKNCLRGFNEIFLKRFCIDCPFDYQIRIPLANDPDTLYRREILYITPYTKLSEDEIESLSNILKTGVNRYLKDTCSEWQIKEYKEDRYGKYSKKYDELRSEIFRDGCLGINGAVIQHYKIDDKKLSYINSEVKIREILLTSSRGKYMNYSLWFSNNNKNYKITFSPHFMFAFMELLLEHLSITKKDDSNYHHSLMEYKEINKSKDNIKDILVQACNTLINKSLERIKTNYMIP